MVVMPEAPTELQAMSREAKAPRVRSARRLVGLIVADCLVEPPLPEAVRKPAANEGASG